MGYMSVISKFPLGLLSPCGVRVLLLLLLLLLCLFLSLSVSLSLSLSLSLFVSLYVSVSVSLCVSSSSSSSSFIPPSCLGSIFWDLVTFHSGVFFGERQDNKVQEKST